MVSTSSPGFSQRDNIRVVFRHGRKATIFFLAVMALVTAYVVLAPRSYQSEGKLFVRLGRENAVLDPTATVGGDGDRVVTIPNSRESEVNSVVEILSSRVLVEAVVKQVGAARILEQGTSGLGTLLGFGGRGRQGGEPQPAADDAKATSADQDNLRYDRVFQKAVVALSDRLNIQPVRRSNVISITYRGQSPELAQSVVSTLIDKHLDEHVRLNRTGGTRAFLTEQADGAREKLAAAERELQNLRAATGLIAPEEQREELVARMGRLEEELATTLGDMAASAEKTQRLRETLATLPETEVTSTRVGLNNHGTDLMREQYYALQLRELELLSRYTETHPSVVEIRKQVADAEQLLRREEPTRTEIVTEPDTAYALTEQELIAEQPHLAALHGRVEQIERSLAKCRHALDRHNQHGTEIARLEREVQIREANFMNYSTSLEQARIDGALEMERISNINVAQPASFEPKPIRPRAVLTLLLGLMSGTFGAVGLTLLAEYSDRTLKGPDDVEKALGVPLLVSIARFERPHLAMNGRN